MKLIGHFDWSHFYQLFIALVLKKTINWLNFQYYNKTTFGRLRVKRNRETPWDYRRYQYLYRAVGSAAFPCVPAKGGSVLSSAAARSCGMGAGCGAGRLRRRRTPCSLTAPPAAGDTACVRPCPHCRTAALLPPSAMHVCHPSVKAPFTSETGWQTSGTEYHSAKLSSN